MISSLPRPERSEVCSSFVHPWYRLMLAGTDRAPRTSRIRVVLVSLNRYQSTSLAVPNLPVCHWPDGVTAAPAPAQVADASVVPVRA